MCFHVLNLPKTVSPVSTQNRIAKLDYFFNLASKIINFIIKNGENRLSF